MSQQHLLKHKNLEFTVLGTETLPSKVTLCISDSKCRYGERLHRVEIVSEITCTISWFFFLVMEIRRMDGHQIAFQRCLKFQNDISVLKLLIRKEKNPSILVFKI